MRTFIGLLGAIRDQLLTICLWVSLESYGTGSPTNYTFCGPHGVGTRSNAQLVALVQTPEAHRHEGASREHGSLPGSQRSRGRRGANYPRF